MPRYTITEPHPTVLENTYTHSGRGGAGNMFRAPVTTSPSGVPSQPKPVSSSSGGRFYSGRGGAGNAHAAQARPTLSFDEAYSRAEVHDKQSLTGHVGRGGAGNFYTKPESSGSQRKNSSSSSRRDSASTTGSHRSGFWSRLSNN